MKTNLLLLKTKALVVILLLLTLCSTLVNGQETLATFQFNNNLSPNPGGLGNPTLFYYKKGNPPISITPNYSGQRLELRSSEEGNFIELTINTSKILPSDPNDGYQNLSVSWVGDFEGPWLGNGSWQLQTFDGTNWTNTDTPLNLSIWTLGGNKSKTVQLPNYYDNNPAAKIRIVATEINDGPLTDARLLLDNLVITSKSPKIKVYTDGDLHIPNLSSASVVLTTDFGTRQTSDPAVTRTFRVRNYLGSVGSLLNVSAITVTGANPGDFTVTPTTLTGIGRSSSDTGTPYKTFSIGFLPLGDGIRTAEISIYSNAAPSPYIFTVIGVGASCSFVAGSYAQNTMAIGQQTLEGNYTSNDLIGGVADPASGNTILTKLYPSGNLYTSSATSWYVRDAEKTVVFDELNISNQKNVSIVFNIAAFTTTNRNKQWFWDNPTDWWENGLNSVSYVTLSVQKPDNTWVDMTLHGSPNPNKYYRTNFTGGSQYVNKSFTSSSVNNSGTPYTSFKFDIPTSSGIQNLKFKIKGYTDSNDRLWLIDDVKVLTSNAIYKTFTTGNVWSPSPPTANEKAIIEGQFVNSGNNTICECEVKDTGSLTIPINTSVTVRGKITNQGNGDNIVVASDGNLIQIEDDAVNTGNITALRNMTPRRNTDSTYSAKEYSFYSSPVYGQNMKAIFGGNTVNTAFALVLNEPGNNFVNANAAQYDVQGKGFAVKDPTVAYYSGLGSPVTVPATFKGVPNNKIEPLAITKTGTKGWNLIGNPYPSNLDLQKFYNDNKSVMESTIRFWDKTVNDTYAQYGGAYNGYSYALYNAVDNVSNPAPGGDGGNNTGTPSGTPGIAGNYRYAKVGQGFLIRSLVASGEIKFKNTQRTTQGAVFFGKNATEDVQDLFRLQLITPTNLVLTQSFIYLDFGSNGFGVEDTGHPSLSSSDTFYSYANDDRVIINGRGTFDKNDVVNLGTKNYAAGVYKIRAIDQEGIFANGQHIYLKDKVLNVIADLTEAPYEFSAEAGEFTNRFEIVYEQETVLGTTDQAKASIELYRDGQDFVVQTPAKKIVHVELYDMSGRLMFSKKANAKTVRFTAETLAEGIYILKGQLEDGEIFTKKLRR